jgi:hypothetical protein
MYANVIMKQNDTANGKVQSTIDPFLATLLEPLALKYPNWEFKEEGTHYTYNNGVKTDFIATCFKVMEKREELGTIYVDRYHRGGDRYAVDNFRIGEMRERGSGMKTIHLKKAIRHVEKFFGRKTTDERMKSAIEMAGHRVHSVSNELNRKASWAWNAINDHAKNFLVAKYWEELLTSLDPKVRTEAEKFPTLQAESEAGDAIHKAVRKGDCYIVNIEGMRYSVKRANDPIQIFTSEDLPNTIKRSVGLLKLLEDDQIIGGVGMRVSAETFVVLPQEI